jgi:protein-S-isoprenylcysteine O-methyltransferase Ste14
MVAQGYQDSPGVVAPPPLIYAVPLAVGLYFNRASPFELMPDNLARIIGVALGIVALILNLAAAAQVWRAHTPIIPYKSTTAIVDTGPFAISRNPMYLSMTIGYVAISLFFNTAWPLLLLPLVLLVMHRGVIARVELFLEQMFGLRFVVYMGRVRRWI